MKRMTTEGIIGGMMIIFSGLIYTFERFVSVFMWVAQFVPVEIKGNGIRPSSPAIPGLFDNIFVPLLFIIGLVLLIFSFVGKIERN